MADPEQWRKFSKPIHNISEEVYFHEVNANRQGRCRYRLTNKNTGLQAEVEWNKNAFDHLVQWKMPGEGDYVPGLESANYKVMDRMEETNSGRIKYLDSSEEKNVHICLTFRHIQG